MSAMNVRSAGITRRQPASVGLCLERARIRRILSKQSSPATRRMANVSGRGVRRCLAWTAICFEVREPLPAVARTQNIS